MHSGSKGHPFGDCLLLFQTLGEGREKSRPTVTAPWGWGRGGFLIACKKRGFFKSASAGRASRLIPTSPTKIGHWHKTVMAAAAWRFPTMENFVTIKEASF